MKISCHDKSYGKDFDFEMVDGDMGGDLSLVFEYLRNYKNILKYRSAWGGKESRPLEAIAWEAKIDRIDKLEKKYDKFIKYLHEIDMEENSL